MREVILTGGDPLMLSPRRLAALLGALAAIPHVETLRIHTRVPVAAPERVTEACWRRWTRDKPLWLVLHANHAREFTAGARRRAARVQRAACLLLGQSVLLRGVNDSAQALEELFRAMLRPGSSPTTCTSWIRRRAPRASMCRSPRARRCWPGCGAG